MLTAIGYEYKTVDEINDGKWLECYKEAKAFFEEHGHFPTKKENVRLYRWAWRWWKDTYLKNPGLHQEKLDMLKNIGFEYKGEK